MEVSCFSFSRRLPAHVIRKEKAMSGYSLSRAIDRMLLSEGLCWRKRSHSIEMFTFGMKIDEQRFEDARPTMLEGAVKHLSCPIRIVWS
ncbi:hypothetical protein MTR_8g031460 [Medicago truncatula]|uniref:Uncharacterized protein n=1 Tax=Medicago truncatula TaxID=3880 RepID=A0A072TZF5_MEDTR|nr:hypothetical protein MTR_8g031460 [Medicago truncatula]